MKKVRSGRDCAQKPAFSRRESPEIAAAAIDVANSARNLAKPATYVAGAVTMFATPARRLASLAILPCESQRTTLTTLIAATLVTGSYTLKSGPFYPLKRDNPLEMNGNFDKINGCTATSADINFQLIGN